MKGFCIRNQEQKFGDGNTHLKFLSALINMYLLWMLDIVGKSQINAANASSCDSICISICYIYVLSVGGQLDDLRMYASEQYGPLWILPNKIKD